MLSQFAGEPSLDNAGNIYSTHHYFRDGKMVEADLYVAHENGKARRVRRPAALRTVN